MHPKTNLGLKFWSEPTKDQELYQTYDQDVNCQHSLTHTINWEIKKSGMIILSVFLSFPAFLLGGSKKQQSSKSN